MVTKEEWGFLKPANDELKIRKDKMMARLKESETPKKPGISSKLYNGFLNTPFCKDISDKYSKFQKWRKSESKAKPEAKTIEEVVAEPAKPLEKEVASAPVKTPKEPGRISKVWDAIGNSKLYKVSIGRFYSKKEQQGEEEPVAELAAESVETPKKPWYKDLPNLHTRISNRVKSTDLYSRWEKRKAKSEAEPEAEKTIEDVVKKEPVETPAKPLEEEVVPEPSTPSAEYTGTKTVKKPKKRNYDLPEFETAPVNSMPGYTHKSVPADEAAPETDLESTLEAEAASGPVADPVPETPQADEQPKTKAEYVKEFIGKVYDIFTPRSIENFVMDSILYVRDYKKHIKNFGSETHKHKYFINQVAHPPLTAIMLAGPLYYMACNTAEGVAQSPHPVVMTIWVGMGLGGAAVLSKHFIFGQIKKSWNYNKEMYAKMKDGVIADKKDWLKTTALLGGALISKMYFF